jgi:hypothetical protein
MTKQEPVANRPVTYRDPPDRAEPQWSDLSDDDRLIVLDWLRAEAFFSETDGINTAALRAAIRHLGGES